MDNDATMLDRYIAFTDRAVAGAADLEELRTYFAADATVQIFDAPVTGIDAIIGFFGGFLSAQADSKHFWNVVRQGEGVLEAEWVAAVRLKNGTLVSAAGFERARIDGDGRIVELRNYPQRPEA